MPSSAQHSASSLVQIKEPLQASLSPSGGSSGAGSTGKRGATKKRRKDPLAPKRPSNAFFIFSQQHRQQAREEKKEGNQSELTKFLGQQWKSMPSTEKKVYFRNAFLSLFIPLFYPIQRWRESHISIGLGVVVIVFSAPSSCVCQLQWTPSGPCCQESDPGEEKKKVGTDPIDRT